MLAEFVERQARERQAAERVDVVGAEQPTTRCVPLPQSYVIDMSRSFGWAPGTSCAMNFSGSHATARACDERRQHMRVDALPQ
jgi:hypothetical protein